jgi:hypothetical protein
MDISLNWATGLLKHTNYAIGIWACLVGLAAYGHPLPNLPVRTDFDGAGKARVEILVDPRAFAEDPEKVDYLTPEVFGEMADEEKDKLKADVLALINKSVTFRFEPTGEFRPALEARFEEIATATEGDAVMVAAVWEGALPEGAEAYQIDAMLAGDLPVAFLNSVRQAPARRAQLLFPGETSHWYRWRKAGTPEAMRPTLETTREMASALAAGDTTVLPSDALARADSIVVPPDSDIEPLPPPEEELAGWHTFVSFLRQGFVHVVPLGLDHVLFVLGLFLLTRAWKPLLLQVSTFTVAHTITLAMGMLGVLRLPGLLVESVIAASIAYIAIENLRQPKYSNWRLAVVFVFGLIHGLGFAGALMNLELSASALAFGLLGFNVGVELGQLSVIAVVLLATLWIRENEQFRKWVTVPGSVIIGLYGAWLAISRVIGG